MEPPEDVGEEWVPSTARAWHTWLAAEERKTVAAYGEKPAFLISDYNSELAITRDYEGREILELLQNANDQAAERDELGRVLIELSADGLIVANTGQPFSVGGVSSLQTSHLSPKRRRRKQQIGNKGLGFRAVLNWSRTPIILSNALSIAYSKEHAMAKMRFLVASHASLAQAIRREQVADDELILPLLPFPLYTADGNLADQLTDQRARKLFERCEFLLLQDYDTVIGMPFNTSKAQESARLQIREVHPEILLFAQHLGEISFSLVGQTPVTWQLAGDKGRPRVLANGKKLGEWEIHRRVGTVPESHTEGESADAREFEIVVAVPTDSVVGASPLYSYFPTDIALPLPAVCHATLELEQNRKHALQGQKSNGFVLRELAHFLAEIAEARAAVSERDPWAGFSLLMPKADFPEELKREGFVQALIEEAKIRAIVPTLANKPMRPNVARLVEGAHAGWLPAEIFPEVVPVRSYEDDRFLGLLGVVSLSGAEIKKRIIAAKELKVEQRAALIMGLLERPWHTEAYTSALFVDADGAAVADDRRVFLAPSTTETPPLPSWANLRFLSQEMRVALGEKLGSREVRELQQRFGVFGLREYSLGNLVRALVTEANAAGKEHPERAATYQTDLLNTVFALYDAEEPGRKKPDYPELSPLHLATQAAKNVTASTLYLGSGFGADGQITQALYGSWAPERLVDATAVEHLTDDRSKLQSFLLWLGVEHWPRQTKTDAADPLYLRATLRWISYPAVFENKVVKSAAEAYSAGLTGVRTVDGLEGILSHADPSAISCWLAKDVRVLDWNRPARDHATLRAVPPTAQKPRYYQEPLFSYVRWKIESTPWLPSTENVALQPKEYVLGERAIEKLFPRPAMPLPEALDQFGVQSSDVVEGWRRAGVLTSLAYLERDEIYAKLLELPLRSPDGKLARPLYNWLLDASENALGGEGVNQREFLARGRMWGRYGSKAAYYPVTELHHADSEGLPQPLLDKLKIVDLPKRVGVEKVERLFGVRPVDRAGIERRIAQVQPAVGSAEVNVEFQEAKPYLHKLRASESRMFSQLQTLRVLELQVCTSLREVISFATTSLEYDVPVWGWVIDGEILYVRSDPVKVASFGDSLFANAVCEALASLFRVADGGDFARILSCPEHDRLELLRRLRGDAAVEDIETIRADYAAPARIIPVPASFPLAGQPQRNPIAPSSPGADLQLAPVPMSPQTSPTTAEPARPLEISERQHTPDPAPVLRKLVVRTIVNSSEGTETVSRHRVTDGEFCERKAMEFEERSEPPRWPIRVAHVMGADGPGCDILSFATEEARDEFRKGPVRDLNSVSRFIEVKGRGDSGAHIELQGNELSTAEEYGDRYFLYRLFEAGHDTYELTALQNPLSHKDSLQLAIHVAMDHAAATRRFSLSGGLSKGS